MSSSRPDRLLLRHTIKMQDLPQRTDMSAERTDAPRPPPIRAYPDQSFDAMIWGMNPYAAGPHDPTVQRLFNDKTNVTLTHFTVENGYFIMSPGLDGVIVTEDGSVLEEAAAFSNRTRYPGQDKELNVPISDVEFDEAFVAFDQAWGNYYHWLLYGLAKMAMMNGVLPSSCKIIAPDLPALRKTRKLSMTGKVYDASIAAAGLMDRLTFLDDGVYRVRKLHCIWHRPRSPEYVTQAPAFQTLFTHINSRTGPDPALPRRIFVSRERSWNNRLTDEQQKFIDRVCDQFGFVKIFLETMSFDQQVAAFRSAEIVMAPHGAGLANILFGSQTLRVLELIRRLDDQQHLRSCFYMMASMNGQPYMFLDTDNDDFTENCLVQALDRLIAA